MILWDNSLHFYIAKLWYLFIVSEEEHIVICLSWNAFGCSRTINLIPRTSYSKDRERWRVVRRGETPLALSFSLLFVASSFLVCFVFDYTKISGYAVFSPSNKVIATWLREGFQLIFISISWSTMNTQVCTRKLSLEDTSFFYRQYGSPSKPRLA